MRILVVEDEKQIANSIKKGLEQETYSVDIAYDGADGYDLAISEEYDVIVLDWMLPEMNGLDFCKKIREEKIQTPILMLTAKSELDDKVIGLNSGADDYLTKPFAFEELIARIKALLRRPQTTTPLILSLADLELNPNSKTVTRNGKNINLSKKEYALLEYFMRNIGITLSKDQIIDHVWNFDDDILQNTVEQYVGYLRNKIEKPFRNSPTLIHTVRGFGYVFKLEENNND